MNTKLFKRVFAFVLIFFLISSGLSIYFEAVFAATGTKDFKHSGVNPARMSYSELSEDKDEAPFVYDDNLDITASELESLISKTAVYFHRMNGTVAKGNGTTGSIKFSDLSQESLMHNNVIYASIGFVYSGDSYAGIVPLKVIQNGNEFNFKPYGSTIHVFETYKPYYSGSTPVAPPVILKDDKTMIYFVSQWFIKYNITSSELKYSKAKQVWHNKKYPAVQYSIGGPPLTDPETNAVYVGSWNGHVYKVNPSDLSYTAINIRNFDVYNGEDDVVQDMIDAGRLSASPTIVTKGGTKRLIFGITTNQTEKVHGGGICSTNINLGDIKCSIGDYYYKFNNNGSRASATKIKTSGGSVLSVDYVVDVSTAWSTRFGYGFVNDRGGNLYGVDINGKVRYKNTAYKGSLVWASPSIDKNQQYGYFAAQSLRSGSNTGTYGSILYNFTDCVPGRVTRFDLNSIVYALNNYGNGNILHTQYEGSNLRSASEFNNGYIYSHSNWLTANEATGTPFIMGRSVVQSMTGCSDTGSVGKMFALNAWYDSNEKPIKNQMLRENLNTKSGGATLDFLMDTSNKNWINVDSMGQFAGPIAGFNVSEYHDEGISINSGKGLTIVYLQNSDFDIVDLSVKSHEIDGKFYQIDPANATPTEEYEGHVRVVTSEKRRLSIPKSVYDNPNAKFRISVFHTNNPVNPSTQENLVCGDPYGIEPCKFKNESLIPGAYTATKLKNNTGNSKDYSKTYRELYRFEVPAASLPVKTVKDSQGNINYIIEPGTPILDKTFKVFKHNYNGSAKEKHQLIAYVDVNNVIREKNESDKDNMAYTNIEYIGKGIERPDLDLVCSIEKPSGQYYNANQDYDLNLTIENTSKEKFVDVNFDYKVKLNGSTFKTGTVSANSFPGGDKRLQAGEVIKLPLSVRFNNGTYSIDVEVNSTRATGPLFEGNNFNNNCNFNISAYPTAEPDLASIAVGPSSETYKFKFDNSGNPLNAYNIDIRGVVQNLGFKRVDEDTNTKMEIYRGNTKIATTNAVCEGIVATNGTCSINYVLPANQVKAGTYTVKLIADSNNNVSESNEYNNNKTTYFFVEPAEVGVPNNYFSPNGGGIKDTVGMGLSSSALTAPDYTYKMEIGIFDQYGTLIKSLKSTSTSYRYPGVGQSVYTANPIFSYKSNYLGSGTANNLWNNVPKNSSGKYVWNGFSTRSGNSTTEVDGIYRIGIRYYYEIPNPNYVYKWTTNGCSYYNTSGSKVYYSCYLPDYNGSKYLTSKTGTYTNYGTEIMLDNTLQIYNVVLKDIDNIRSGSYLEFEQIQTRLEASEVWLLIPQNLIILDGFKTTNVTKVGDYYKVPLVSKWSTNYKNSDTFRSNGDPYSNEWNIANGDGIILDKFAPDGNHEIKVVAITRTDTPNSPTERILNIQLGDSYYKHIKINENRE